MRPEKAKDLALLEPRSSRWLRRLRSRWALLERDLGVVALALARTAAVAFAGVMVWLMASTLLGIVPAFAELQAWLGVPAPELGSMFWRAVGLVLMLGWLAGKTFVFVSGGVLGLRIGLGEVLLPAFRRQDPRCEVVHVAAEALVLRGRPGLGVYLTLQSVGMVAGEVIELVVRLRDHRGSYLSAALAAFRGPQGELLVRRDWRVPRDAEGPDGDPEEVGIFVPLLAVDARQRRFLHGRVEVLLFSQGTYLADGAASLSVRLDDPAFQGLDLLPEGPASRRDRPAALLSGYLQSLDQLPEGRARHLERELEVLAERIRAGAVRCPVCGDLLSDRDPGMVSCTRCGTPSHGECWDFTGRCSTFACEGSSRFGPGEARATLPAVAKPSALVRADVRRRTDAPALPEEVDLELAGVPVPREPPTLWELRPVALLYAACLTMVPLVAAAVLAVVAPWLFLLLVVAAAAFALAIPRGAMALLLLPGALARPVLSQAFPAPGTRDLSHYLRIRRVDLRARPEEDGGGAVLEGLLLARGLARHRLDFTLRLRGPRGYLTSPRPEVTGVYGELRCLHSSAALEGEGAAPLAFSMELPGDALALESRGPVPVGFELLISCDGEVLSEADGVGSFRPGEGRGALAFGVAVPTPETRRDPRGRNIACGLCGDPVGVQVVACRSCDHLGHPGCWEFLSVCPACGSPDGV